VRSGGLECSAATYHVGADTDKGFKIGFYAAGKRPCRAEDVPVIPEPAPKALFETFMGKKFLPTPKRNAPLPQIRSSGALI
jgi:hypothetical protein